MAKQLGAGTRMRMIRERSGETQAAFAKKMGVSHRAWQGYELGKNVPGGKVLATLARMGYNVNWVLTGAGSIRNFEGAPELTADPMVAARANPAEALELDQDLLAQLIEKVCAHEQVEDGMLCERKKASIIAHLYTISRVNPPMGSSDKTMERLIKLASN